MLSYSTPPARGHEDHESDWLFDDSAHDAPLLDENISPPRVRLFTDIDVYSQSVQHVDLVGRGDHFVWHYALDHDFAVVTTKTRDFIELLEAPVHPEAIVLREGGLSRQE